MVLDIFPTHHAVALGRVDRPTLLSHATAFGMSATAGEITWDPGHFYITFIALNYMPSSSSTELFFVQLELFFVQLVFCGTGYVDVRGVSPRAVVLEETQK